MRQKTLGLRHGCVKLLAPKLYKDWCIASGKDSVDFERPMISFLKKRFGDKSLVGCEIGVREGINSLRILKTLNVEKLFLVDPYLPYYEPCFPVTVSIDYQNKVRGKAKQLLKEYGDRVVWVNVTSNKAVCSIDRSLDFCYIDGDHSYSQVKLDIMNYSSLVKCGGVLGGHDFASAYLGLCRAVLKFRP